jgi:beta-glucosidase-like glycosyl hydrolase
LLTDVLRGEWNFTGYVIGDAGAIKFIQTDHEWAPSQAAAAADALKAGADMALGGGCSGAVGCISFGAVPQAVEQGLVATADVDLAVSRILARGRILLTSTFFIIARRMIRWSSVLPLQQVARLQLQPHPAGGY